MSHIKTIAISTIAVCTDIIPRGFENLMGLFIRQKPLNQQEYLQFNDVEPKIAFIIDTKNDIKEDVIDRIYDSLDYRIKIAHTVSFNEAFAMIPKTESNLALCTESYIQENSLQKVSKNHDVLHGSPGYLQSKINHTNSFHSEKASMIEAIDGVPYEARSLDSENSREESLRTLKSGKKIRILGSNGELAVIKLVS